MTEETEGREEIARIQAALLQNELSDSQSLAAEFRLIVRHMEAVYDAALASHAPSDKNAEGLIWAVERWNLEVNHRPVANVHYRTLDETWRQVMRHFGGDPDELVGPPPQYSVPSEAAAQPTEVNVAKARQVLDNWARREVGMEKCVICERYHFPGNNCEEAVEAEIEHNDH